MDRKLLVGRRISELRTAKKLTQEKLAERLGITWRYVSLIERGRANPPLELLLKFADALGVEPSVLFTFPDEGWTRKKARRDIANIIDAADDKRLREIMALLRARES